MRHIIHKEDDQNRRRNFKNFNCYQLGLRVLVLVQLFFDAPAWCPPSLNSLSIENAF
jgi:hypothetical protein